MYEMLVFLDFFLSYKGTIHILCIFKKEVIEKAGCPMNKSFSQSVFLNSHIAIVTLHLTIT